MNFREQYLQAKKAGLTDPMTYKSVSFEKSGQNIIGELVDIQPTHFDKTDSTVNKYILKTDDGLVSVILGAIGDGQLDGRVYSGDVLSITFIEKKQLTGGRTANIFDIDRLKGDVVHGQEKDDKTTVD